MSGSKDNTSTLQSYVDSASATAQSVLGSITGNPADKREAANKHDEAKAKDELSHAGTSVGGFSIGSTGVAANDPQRSEGSWNQTIGSAKEAVGGLVGADGLKRDGQEQNAQGKGQEAAGQASDLGKGISDRVSGTVGGAVASLTGDKTAQESRQLQHDQGKALQRGTESDINKSA